MDPSGLLSRTVAGTGGSPDYPCHPNVDAVGDLVGLPVAAVERELIMATLVLTGGNRTHAATILGISLRTLRNKLTLYRTEDERVQQ